jgi:ABC-type transporter Mla subunit MlaD
MRDRENQRLVGLVFVVLLLIAVAVGLLLTGWVS